MLSAIFGVANNWRGLPSALLAATTEIADRCKFSLDELRYEYPEELVPPDYTAHGWLRELTETESGHVGQRVQLGTQSY